ncbi:MAG: RsmB/NOP family class I SAM-dependent RNA methyltransferase [Candidatus Pacearchaeota archaeon]|nr:RsmB/NOP family class I SAM-dependent RNA methyltransferase [Candidatus Pacearchaeota archaeon]
MKPLFEERMRELLRDEGDFNEFEKIIHTSPLRFIRCNTLKISCDELFKRLNNKWKVVQPFRNHGEIMLVESELLPGELGNAIEHLLGYYYVQEVSSMMSVLALNPKPGEFVLDLCASPGSKTTQMAATMKNEGTIIANDIKLDRIKILSANLERCGVMNCIAVRNDGAGLCERFAKQNFKFDKILLDAPCSGEGTLRSSPKTFLMWNYKIVKKFSREQRRLFISALKCLKVGGEIVYSTCTHSPEENEEVVDFILKKFPVDVEKVILPLKCRSGVVNWGGKNIDNNVEKCCRIYPQDNDSEGFFIAKFKLLEDLESFRGKND